MFVFLLISLTVNFTLIVKNRSNVQKIFPKVLILFLLILFFWTGFKIKNINQCGQVNYIPYIVMYLILLVYILYTLLKIFFRIGYQIEKEYDQMMEIKNMKLSRIY